MKPPVEWWCAHDVATFKTIWWSAINVESSFPGTILERNSNLRLLTRIDPINRAGAWSGRRSHSFWCSWPFFGWLSRTCSILARYATPRHSDTISAMAGCHRKCSPLGKGRATNLSSGGFSPQGTGTRQGALSFRFSGRYLPGRPGSWLGTHVRSDDSRSIGHCPILSFFCCGRRKMPPPCPCPLFLPTAPTCT